MEKCSICGDYAEDEDRPSKIAADCKKCGKILCGICIGKKHPDLIKQSRMGDARCDCGGELFWWT